MTDKTSNKILIVDDTPENLALLTELLQKKDYEISAANDGQRALKIASHIIPDLILLDVMMPGIDGFETCKHLKNQDSTKNIPVIFITAKTDIDDLVTGFSVGGADYINKPFNNEEVYVRVENQLKIQRLQKKVEISESKLRKLLEEYQQQSDQLQQIVTLVVDGLIELNQYGEIQETNPAVETLFGYSASQLKKMNISSLFADPYSQKYKQLFNPNSTEAKQLLSKTKTVELLGQRHDDTTFPIAFSLINNPVRKTMYLAVIHDITSYKNKENKLRHLSYVDPLTNLANRRYFDEHFEKIWQQRQRSKDQIAFIMIDIDFFKQYNDSYGHQAGDECLKQVAQSLKNNIKRPGDIIARIGGEEFAIVLHDTSREGVIQIAERLKNDVQALRIPHENSDFNVITISLGINITEAGEKSQSASMLYQMADEALYQSKQSGRNKFTFFKDMF